MHEIKEAGRIDEMSEGRLALIVSIGAGGDIIVRIIDTETGQPLRDSKGEEAIVEFCTTSGGGGQSLHTHRALHTVFYALLKDGKRRPGGIPQYPVYLRGVMEDLGKDLPVEDD